MQAEATARAAAAVSGGAAGVGAGEGVAAGEAGDAALLAEVMRHVAAERAARQLEARLMQARATDYAPHGLCTTRTMHHAHTRYVHVHMPHASMPPIQCAPGNKPHTTCPMHKAYVQAHGTPR